MMDGAYFKLYCALVFTLDLKKKKIFYAFIVMPFENRMFLFFI